MSWLAAATVRTTGVIASDTVVFDIALQKFFSVVKFSCFSWRNAAKNRVVPSQNKSMSAQDETARSTKTYSLQ